MEFKWSPFVKEIILWGLCQLSGQRCCTGESPSSEGLLMQRLTSP
jgi:hypothetical protein